MRLISVLAKEYMGGDSYPLCVEGEQRAVVNCAADKVELMYL